MILPRSSHAERLAVCVLVSRPGPRTGDRGVREILGRRGASALARAFFDDTWAEVMQVPWADASCALLPARSGWRGRDAGERVERLLARGIERTGAALAVFADGPGVPRLLLDRARVGLGRVDAVIGPREGGGLYLLGMSRAPDGLLAGIALDGPDAFRQVRERLRAAGRSVEVLTPWIGVAEPADLGRLRRAMERGEVHAPATSRRMARPRISAVLPLLDEEHRVASALTHLTAIPNLDEVVVVDGGSRDRTVSIARRFPVRVIEAERAPAAAGDRGAAEGRGRAAARARQWNLGARIATADVLWFVLPEVIAPREATVHIADALVDPGTVGGAFRTWTVPDEWRPWFAPLLHAGDVQLRLAGLPRADQALFVRAEAFAQAGGYPELLESCASVELARRLRRLGRLARVPARVLVSSSRLHGHPLRHAAATALAPLLHRAGVPAGLLRAVG